MGEFLQLLRCSPTYTSVNANFPSDSTGPFLTSVGLRLCGLRQLVMAANIVVRISLRLYNHHQISSAIMVGGGDEIPTASRLWLNRYDALMSTPKAK